MDTNSQDLRSIVTHRPVAICMVVIAVCVFGWISYQRLAISLMPDISYPTITVRTEYPGAAPEEVEYLVSRRLEESLGIIQNLVSIKSISKAGLSNVILEFKWNVDMDLVTQEVREKADRVFLPREATKPMVLRYDPSLDPVMTLALHGPQSLYDLRYLAEHDIKRALETVSGVAAVKVKGGWEEEIRVALDGLRVASLGLDVAQVNQILRQNNLNLPGGDLEDGQQEYLVRMVNEFKSIDDIADLVIMENNGAKVRLGDIAEVYRSPKDIELVTRLNEQESVEIDIFKEGDANVISVVDLVRNKLYGLPEQREYIKELEAEKGKAKKAEDSSKKKNFGQLRREEAQKAIRHLRMTDFLTYKLPADTELEVLADQSLYIKSSVTEVKNNAIIGGLMAVLVLFAFLRSATHTLIIGITMPVSIVATFIPLNFFGVSLNIMSLGGLALGVGMLVDNSIVVLESIFSRREKGDDLITATIKGLSEIRSAVVASTLTTVAVFFPIVYVEGIAGQVFRDMALTVVFSLLASLIVAIFLIPMLSSRRIGSAGLNLSSKSRKSPFWNLKAMDWFTDGKATGSKGFREIIGDLFSVGPGVLWQMLAKIGLSFACLLLAFLKAILSFASILIWPLDALVMKLILRKETLFKRFAGWAGKDLSDKRKIYPGLVAFEAPAQLLARMDGLVEWYEAKSVIKSFLFAPFALIGGVYFLAIRYPLHVFIRLIISVIQLLILVAGILLISLLALGGLIILPVIAPALFVFEKGFSVVENNYPSLLERALGQRSFVIAGALTLFAFCIFGIAPRLGSELIPQANRPEFELTLALPVGTPLERTTEIVKAIEPRLRDVEHVDIVSATVGVDSDDLLAGEKGDHTADFFIRLKDGTDGRGIESVVTTTREIAEGVPDSTVKVSFPDLFSFKTPVEVELYGNDLLALRETSQEIAVALRGLPFLADVKSSQMKGNPELQVTYDRDRLSELGLNLGDVAQIVHDKVRGSSTTSLRRREENIDILVRLAEEDRLGVSEILRITVNPNGDVPIPLGAVATVEINEGPSEIRRLDRQRVASITANTVGADLGTASELIYAVVSEIDLPEGLAFRIGGQDEEMKVSQKSLSFALILAIFLVYVVMASQFESLLHPFIILFSVPLAFIGVAFALFIAGIPLSIIVFLGLITLAGIVVNNAIVLIDCINQAVRTGKPQREAIMSACKLRLRPILITTTTTVLGLIPMSLGLGDGGEIRAPLAIAVISGLTSSTILTLIVIPCIYSFVEREKSVETATPMGEKQYEPVTS